MREKKLAGQVLKVRSPFLSTQLLHTRDACLSRRLVSSVKLSRACYIGYNFRCNEKRSDYQE
jgi:hypothetical protein